MVFAGLDDTPPPAPPPPFQRYVVTYYDRNGDGKVDYELHSLPDSADADWALVDTAFAGYYTLRIDFGMVPVRRRVHIRVPPHVHLTEGQPPRY